MLIIPRAALMYGSGALCNPVEAVAPVDIILKDVGQSLHGGGFCRAVMREDYRVQALLYGGGIRYLLVGGHIAAVARHHVPVEVFDTETVQIVDYPKLKSRVLREITVLAAAGEAIKLRCDTGHLLNIIIYQIEIRQPFIVAGIYLLIVMVCSVHRDGMTPVHYVPVVLLVPGLVGHEKVAFTP